MQKSFDEQDALIWFDPFIESECDGRWFNLELEDRISEARLIFCQALRMFPLGSGHFWDDYLKMLHPYMDELNRQTPSLKYPVACSLDRPYRNDSSTKSVSLMDTIKGCGMDSTRLEVASFKQSLQEHEKAILCSLEQRLSRKAISLQLGISPHILSRTIRQLGIRYLTCQWEEN